jgi:hypothetical protein
MIAYTYIRKNVRSLNSRYQRARSIQDASYYSKLAILELCGWIETSLDELILGAGYRILKKDKNKKYLKKRVKMVYGFDYEIHFTSMIVALFGISGFEKIENSIDDHIVVNFKNELINLKTRRDSLAHTYTRGATTHYDAPSITLSRLENVAAGILAYDAALRAFSK